MPMNPAEKPHSCPPARIAFADLNFSWPPNGGADIDLYYVASALQAAGYAVCLFGAHEIGSTDRGRFDPACLPFPAVRFSFSSRRFTAACVTQAFRGAIDSWHPSVVFLQHGYALKPLLAKSLAHHRSIGRYYAHELACARNPYRFKDGAPCPSDYLRTPEVCRQCALNSQKAAIQHGRASTWTSDYIAARAYAPRYYAEMLEGLHALDMIVVSNAGLRQHLDGFHPNVRIVPGGVDITRFRETVLPEKQPSDKKIVLMSGRAEDPSKGLNVLLEAGRILARQRSGFEIWATHYDRGLSSSWFKPLDWQSQDGMRALYAACDVCVVPSLWEEPFGLVAVEAMAMGRPVCASAVGGLREIVRPGETGFLFAPGDSAELAKQLDILLDNYPLRVRLGAQGRCVAEREYDWQSIVMRHYTPIIEELMR